MLDLLVSGFLTQPVKMLLGILLILVGFISRCYRQRRQIFQVIMEEHIADWKCQGHKLSNCSSACLANVSYQYFHFMFVAELIKIKIKPKIQSFQTFCVR